MFTIMEEECKRPGEDVEEVKLIYGEKDMQKRINLSTKDVPL